MDRNELADALELSANDLMLQDKQASFILYQISRNLRKPASTVCSQLNEVKRRG